MNNSIIHQIVRQHGGQKALAKSMGLSQPAVSKWITGKSMPGAKAVLQMVRATQGRVTPYELRPDLYPDPDWMPPGLIRAT